MRIGMLIFPMLEELDLVGPWEMVSMWSQQPGGPEVRLLVAQSQDPVVCAKGLSLNPHVTFETCPELDVLVVPGGQGTRTEVDNPVLVDFIRRQAPGCQAILSVCTGAFLLHRAGLLSGKRATTHWASLDRLRTLGDVEVVEERWVRDGRIWTAAGVSAGIDLALAYIADAAGEYVAGRVQLAAEYFPNHRIHGEASRHPQAPRYVRSNAP
jgi:transcriptional regulator GlxA family with amidase domain